MEVTTKSDKSKEELFERFLFYLERFLSKNSVIANADPGVLYIQKPQKAIDTWVARGVVRIGDSQYIVNVELKESGSIEVESDAFWFFLSPTDVSKFLEEVEKE